jgi:hypothetical protein
MAKRHVKKCPGCGEEFTLRRLLESSDIRPEGLSFEQKYPELNMFYFTHTAPDCGTTFVIPVGVFLTVLDEPVPSDILAGTAVCENHCLHIDDWTACSQNCYYAPFRRLLISMIKRKGTPVEV